MAFHFLGGFFSVRNFFNLSRNFFSTGFAIAILLLGFYALPAVDDRDWQYWKDESPDASSGFGYICSTSFPRLRAQLPLSEFPDCLPVSRIKIFSRSNELICDPWCRFTYYLPSIFIWHRQAAGNLLLARAALCRMKGTRAGSNTNVQTIAMVMLILFTMFAAFKFGSFFCCPCRPTTFAITRRSNFSPSLLEKEKH
jgi:hypothetical protein